MWRERWLKGRVCDKGKPLSISFLSNHWPHPRDSGSQPPIPIRAVIADLAASAAISTSTAFDAAFASTTSEPRPCGYGRLAPDVCTRTTPSVGVFAPPLPITAFDVVLNHNRGSKPRQRMAVEANRVPRHLLIAHLNNPPLPLPSPSPPSSSFILLSVYFLFLEASPGPVISS